MRVMVGVCGSISAYKAPELVRQLQQRGVSVDVAITRSARRFISPLTFAALTGRTVYTSLWQPSAERADDSSTEFSIEHLIAPAMNVNMWNHPATQANVTILRERGVIFIEPESGHLACGMTGGGRLAS